MMGHEDTKGLGRRRWDDPGLRNVFHGSRVDGALVGHAGIVLFWLDMAPAPA